MPDEGKFEATRALTDAGLGVERDSADVASARNLSTMQRAIDDHLERDRLMADERLSKFRSRADDAMAHARSVAPAPNDEMASERQTADADKQAERQGTDALVDLERKRWGEAVDRQRLDVAKDQERLAAHRRETDVLLTTERDGADVTLHALGETKDLLLQAHQEESRRAQILEMVTHDLRSPLSVLTLCAQSIIDDTSDPIARETALDMRQAAARMARLLTDLLDVARIESETLRIVRQPHDVGELAREVLRSYEPLFASRGMTFTVEAPDGVVIACFDYDRIVQVLSNLFSNAMKFVPTVGGRVHLAIVEKSDRVEFSLRDDGPGIPQSALPHVFKRFWQVDGETRRGLGLGLHICQSLVHAHDGKIWVESTFGEGATFSFALPLE